MPPARSAAIRAAWRGHLARACVSVVSIGMGSTDHQAEDRILCIRLSGLGDVVHALNALALLRRDRPDAHIAWLVEDRFADLLEGHPQIDELIAVPRRPWDRMLRNPLRWPPLGSQAAALALRLRRMGFGASVDFQSSLKSTWLVMAAGAPLRVGFGGAVSREFNSLVQNRLVEAPRAGIHRIERDLALLAALGIRPRYAPAVLPQSEEDRVAVDRALAGRSGGGPLVVIHPGTSKYAAFKRWVPERYAAVADALGAECGATVLVSHGPADRDVAEEVVARAKGGAALAPPTAGLLQVPASCCAGRTSSSAPTPARCTWPRRSACPWWRSSAPRTPSRRAPTAAAASSCAAARTAPHARAAPAATCGA